MLCLELSVNGKKVATAGLAGYGVISNIVTWVHRRREPQSRVDVSLGGIDSNTEPGEHLHWARADLAAGDTVTLRVVENVALDAPRRQTASKGNLERPRLLRLELKAAEVRSAQLRSEIEKLEACEGSALARRRPSQKRLRRRPSPRK